MQQHELSFCIREARQHCRCVHGSSRSKQQGRARQGRAGQGRVGQGGTEQGREGQGRAGQGREGQGRAGQGRAGRGGDRAGQGKTCMGMRPSQENWKLAQLWWGCTNHSSTRQSVKNAITRVRSRSCTTGNHQPCQPSIGDMTSTCQARQATLHVHVN